ncbi:hypothetical protein BC939DRAFT_442080 [Gamsiella multidivaricata]|uniref:uncharacterized protein n=1 Tax=Gamsiella multidivaricata TaxID=101098 RepID=UPI00221E7DB2|nr:uncharacterized protein BC939DRAFT_442080 [Gamsiella multidivaricata]KAI7829494.1 hypothetical protein BC939DRAFT_442080 [Gamsiella multidivaricata]
MGCLSFWRFLTAKKKSDTTQLYENREINAKLLVNHTTNSASTCKEAFIVRFDTPILIAVALRLPMLWS